MKTSASLVVALAILAAPASAQRSAVSSDLSPELAAEAFTRAVRDVCVAAVAGNGVSSLAAAREGKLQPTQDAETRRQTGAAADESVWDIVEARGVATVHERAGRCVVSVYGPATVPTVLSTMQLLTGAGFEAMVGQASTGAGFTQTLLGSSGGKRMTVQLSGAEPGAAGNRSKFSVVTATVSLAQ